MINLLNASQMLADIGMAENYHNDTSKTPHPQSLDGPLVDWCKLPAEEQVWQWEERCFEKRLKAHIQKLHLQGGIQSDALNAIANRHRRQWRAKRRGTEPPSIKKQQRNYDDFDQQQQEPNWQDTGS